MSNLQLVCNDTKSLESLHYWVAYVITTQFHVVKIWSYLSWLMLLNRMKFKNILNQIPLNPYCVEDITPLFIEVYLEAYLELVQAFKMMLYAEKVNGIKMLAFFSGKSSILNVWLDSKYVICSKYFQRNEEICF